MNWNDFTRDVHQTAVDNGLWDKPRTFDDVICECLVHLGRAYEEYRNGRPNYYHLCQPSGEKEHPCEWDLQKPCPLSTGELACEHRDHKPHGVAAELGECVLRILDCLGSWRMKFDRDMFPVYLGKTQTELVCDVTRILTNARFAENQGDRTRSKYYLILSIEKIMGWGKNEGVDMKSILGELHECDKALAGRRERETP